MNKPTPFGKYYLIDRVNVGGMAEVFKAKVMGVEGFERIVALKRILPHIAEDEEFITMFIDEAKIAVQLQHANIAQIFDLGKVDEAYFIALEYVHGRDMRGIFDDLHRRRQVMPTQQICFVIMQVCEGLDYAHNKRDHQGRSLNLVHRDVSPQNILVGFEGEVKLIDFGIAKAAGKASKTQAGILKGKFGYMSPEQVRGLAIDRRSDIFALGIILYEMLTGERLFVGESDFSTLEKVRNVEIIPPSSINSQIPEQLERIVLKALAKDVEDRYQNALDLHDDLQAFLYTTGKFSSRKDLSAWMKRSFPAAAQADEVAEVSSTFEVQDVEELEADTEELTPGAQSKTEHRRREQGLGWDDEELETSIYNRPEDGSDSPRPQMGERSFDSDDKTVAAAPSEAILAEMGEGFSAPATFAEKVPTQRDERPASLRHTMMGVGHTPPARPLPLPPAARLTGSPSAPTRPSTMMGQARLSAPHPTVTPGPQAPLQMGRPILAPLGAPAASEPHRSSPLRQTLMGVGVPSAPLPGGRLTGGMAAPPSLFPPQPLVSLDPGQTYPPGVALPAQGYGARLTAGMDVATTTAAAMSLRPSSKLKYYLLFLAFMALGGGGAYMYLTRPGKIQIAVKPQDARVTVDGKTVENGPPYVIEKRPGIYHVAAAREGYVSREQNVEIRAGQVERTEMELEPSPDTGFELTSLPPGGLVWLDGQAFAVNETGKQATTNFRASRISPGRHVLEIKGDPKFKDWRQEIYQEPGQTLKIHAEREPIGGGARPGAAGPAPGSRSASAPAAAAPAPTPPPAARPSSPSPAPAVASDEGRGKTGSGSRRSGGRSAKPDDSFEDPFAANEKPAAPPAPKPKSKTVTDEDIFATLGASPSGSSGGGGGGEQCTATIGSKPWAQVAIDGKPTGKSTPLMDYSLPCGKHRITFTNPDLMIERNEIIILKAGQRFKKIFPLVDMDF